VKKPLLFFGKLVVSTVLIIYLLRKLDLSVIYSYLGEVRISWIIIAIFLLGIGRLITGWRWKVLLNAQGIHIPFKTLLSFLFVSNFFNTFLPSTIGGDAMRASDSSRHSRLPAESITTIVVERMLGICALGTVAFVSFLCGISFKKHLLYLFWPVLLFLVVTYAALILVLNRRTSMVVAAIFKKMRIRKLSDKVRKVSLVLSELKQNKASIIGAGLLSLLLQVNVIIYTYVAALSLNLRIPLIDFFIIVPIVLLILILPVSINGIGLRENAYTFMFAGYIAGEEAVALSWVLLALTLLLGGIGGLFYLGRH
jgi:uncharacterized protein (TIRG00374 family)